MAARPGISSTSDWWDEVVVDESGHLGGGLYHAGEEEDDPVMGVDYTLLAIPVPAPAGTHPGSAPWALARGPLWSVNTDALTPAEIDGHLKALTCVPNKGKSSAGEYGPPKTFAMGHVVDGRLHMPPHYAAAAFPAAVPISCALETGSPWADELVFTGSLWKSYPPQAVAVSAWCDWRAANLACPHAILSLPCGHGKSVICLAIAAFHVRRVTLIIVHMRGLLDQWMDEARRYIPGVRVGYISADHGVRVDGVDIIVASIQSLHAHMKRDEAYLDVLRRRVGFVVVDEAHHGVASTYQAVLAALPAAVRLAVTATPRRGDNLFGELQYLFGPVVFRSFRRKGDCQAVCVRYENPAFQERRMWGRLRMDLMENDLLADERRTRAVVDVVLLLMRTQGRRVLVLSPRLDQVRDLYARFTAELSPEEAAEERAVALFVPEKPPRTVKRKGETAEEVAVRRTAVLHAWQDSGPHGKVTAVQAPVVGQVLPTMDPALERRRNYEARVVVATTDIMKEGISFNDWDTLVDLDNCMDTEQLVGRIQRVGDKKVPLVVDVYSPVSLFTAMFRSRLRMYKGEHYDVHHVTVTGSEGSDLQCDWTCRGMECDEEFWSQFNRRATAVL